MFRLRVAPEVGFDAAFTTFSNYWFEFELMAMENAESCVVVSSNSDVNNFLHGNTVEVNKNLPFLILFLPLHCQHSIYSVPQLTDQISI